MPPPVRQLNWNAANQELEMLPDIPINWELQMNVYTSGPGPNYVTATWQVPAGTPAGTQDLYDAQFALIPVVAAGRWFKARPVIPAGVQNPVVPIPDDAQPLPDPHETFVRRFTIGAETVDIIVVLVNKGGDEVYRTTADYANDVAESIGLPCIVP